MSKAKKNPQFIKELFSKPEAKQIKKSAITEIVVELNNKDAFIDSRASVIKAVKEQKNLEVNLALTSEVLHDFKMRYRKILHIPLQSNSERCLVLRQRWALAFLGLAKSKKIILNVDESTLGMSDF